MHLECALFLIFGCCFIIPYISLVYKNGYKKPHSPQLLIWAEAICSDIALSSPLAKNICWLLPSPSPQGLDPVRQHPAHLGKCTAAAGEAQFELEEGLRGVGAAPAFPGREPLLEGPGRWAARRAARRGRVEHLLHQQRAGTGRFSDSWMPSGGREGEMPACCHPLFLVLPFREWLQQLRGSVFWLWLGIKMAFRQTAYLSYCGVITDSWFMRGTGWFFFY